jgi:Zn ribbon nucleic-acid-binding protein
MIRIIDETPHPTVVKQVVCRNCGCTLEYTPNDVKNYVHHDYGGGSDTVYHINCLKCNHQINVSRR